MSKRNHKLYRHIYETHYGSIPKEPNGRSYEIHHIDGDHSNNDPLNLKAVTIQEHYDIHYAQEDWGSCILIAERINVTPQELSRLATLENNKRVAEGTHPWLGGEMIRERVENGTHNFLKRDDGSSLGKDVQDRRVADGTHPWIGDGSYQRQVQLIQIENGTHNLIGSPYAKKMYDDGTHPFIGGEVQRKSNQERLQNGTHHLLGGEQQRKQLADGKHSSQIKWKCSHCGTSGNGSTNYKRWHGNKCKMNPINQR
jgi:hypothetical protein